ncbi:2-oxo acid dehydrogenase subunit E2 [Halomicrobium urmianum]|uniref:2-oxo acid dehydrogenase subunit E2 n=1 Tax=Halomicrobium urmianum TaxID=1586233 RepID=UPI001CDA3B2F|nr:2-oxo acid dehydrogenase subunit E2 [Halomicrobium urmianum]
MSDDNQDDDTSSDGPAPRTVAEERTLSPMRRTIADRLQESSRNAVQFTLSREVDAEALAAAADAAGGVVTVTDVLLCALSDALDEHPAFNATFEDGTHLIYEEHNVSVAVAVEAGLVTPVLADAASLSLAEVADERRRLTEAVRSGDYAMSDLKGGTFTLSNLGPLGVDSFSPVINPPQIAILGVNRIRERAVPRDGEVEGRRRLNLDLTLDHRVVDGADGARFLRTLDERLQDAESYVEG